MSVMWMLIVGGILLAPFAVVLLGNVAVWLWDVLSDYEARAMLIPFLVFLAAIAGAGFLVAAGIVAVTS